MSAPVCFMHSIATERCVTAQDISQTHTECLHLPIKLFSTWKSSSDEDVTTNQFTLHMGCIRSCLPCSSISMHPCGASTAMTTALCTHRQYFATSDLHWSYQLKAVE